MKKYLLLILVLGLMALAGCANMDANNVKTDVSNNTIRMVNSGLPIKKLVIKSANGQHELQVELAANEQQRKIGLMNRVSMDENKGMLFSFDTQGYLYFWMKNTLFPLDMVFVDENGEIQHIAHNAQPCTSANDADCAKISSVKPVRYVLEINGGIADKLKISEGDQVTWS